MMRIPVLLFVAAGAVSLAAAPSPQQPSRNTPCADWRECRDLALAAADRGEYEPFHDLAWRAVQVGPSKDASLMYLLARAQALSGRPHDALIMLLRLADMGVAEPEALTSDDFRRTRELPAWADAEPRIAGGGGSAPASAASVAAPRPVARPGASPAAAPAAAPASAPVSTVALQAPAALRFSSAPFAISGLAYDALSSRFVLGDRAGRKLILVDERSKEAMDLVRGDSAGFLDITGVEIDGKRGDLWVTSTRDGAGILHRLQLSSGRPLRAYTVPSDLGPAKLVDLTVAPNGTVLVLDAQAGRVFALRPRGTAIERIVQLDVPDALSIAAADDRTIFVASGSGVTHVDLQSRTRTAVAVPSGTTLGRLERIRRQGSGLVAVQTMDDGSRRVLRLDLNGKGTAITKASRLDVAAPAGEQMFVTTSGDELVWLNAEPADGASAPGAAGRRPFVAYRVPLP
jgi:hypothetical protein